MGKKSSQGVKLVVPKYGIEKVFSISHAERLLDMGPIHNGGWILPEDSEYIYDEENGIRIKSDKRNSEISE